MKPFTFSLQDGSDVRMNLSPRQVATTQGGVGLAVECLSGSVWITLDGGGFDHVLNPGERLSLDGSGRVVVEGLAHSELAFYRVEVAAEETVEPLSDLLRYPAECWRAFVNRLSPPRCNMETPF